MTPGNRNKSLLLVLQVAFQSLAVLFPKAHSDTTDFHQDKRSIPKS